MRANRIADIILITIALHVLVLSILFGPRQVGYIVSATLSATWIWGVVFLTKKWHRRAGPFAGIVVGMAFQQVAYRYWKAELPSFWWAFAQFAAIQLLMGMWARKAVYDVCQPDCLRSCEPGRKETSQN